ncbi:TnpV protein [Bacteroides caecimuris]|uniref:TnpV protein n=1 Tax=Bacteroides caecimuris TaxID=1796613 RepID=UPI0025725435|nr:TnpV protein [Bacteroides caecimuris]
MAKSLFEELGGRYERQGDYLIPCLSVPAEEEQPIGIWGQRHMNYLKQYHKVTYTNLLTSGMLNAYLVDVDRQAQERSHRLIEGMKQTQDITEQLKAENALEWTGKMNNIRACARKIVYDEIIYA